MVPDQRTATDPPRRVGTKHDKTSLLCVLAFAIIAGPRAAALSIDVVSNVKPAPPAVTVTMRRVDGDAPVRVLDVPVGKTTVLDDLAEGTWEIRTTSDLYWSAPAYTTAAGAVTLQLWSLGSVSGKLSGRAPGSGILLLHFAPPTSAREGGPTGVIECPFSGADWTCPVPFGEFDLRFDLAGFATAFRWGVKVDGAVKLAELALTPGSSVSGRVVILRSKSENEIGLHDVVVAAVAENVDPTRGPVRNYAASPDARGFFQIRGLPPGRYRLHARSKNHISDARSVEIIQLTNATLNAPLLLAKPTAVAVKITPPLDLREHKRWQVELVKIGDRSDRAEIIDQSLASTSGAWSIKLSPGSYALTIEEQDGSHWKEETFVIEAGDAQLPIDVLVTGERVSGTVTLGDKPIAATIRLQDEHGPALVADEQGRFEGVFPLLHTDDVHLFVTSTTPDVKRDLMIKGKRSPDDGLYFDITIPATVMSGRTINEDGSPEPSAIVTLQSKDNDDPLAFEQMFSGSDGTFQFEGFAPGIYALKADGFLKSSEVVDFDATTDASSAPVDLVLRAEETVAGVVTMNGMAVAGAKVYAFPRDSQVPLLHPVTTDSAGRFLVTLPHGTKLYDAIVFPRGFYIAMGRITRDPKQKGLTVDVGQDGGALMIEGPDDRELMLLAHAGSQYPAPWVATEGDGTITSADGVRRIVIPNLEPGEYSVCRRGACKSVYVPRFSAASIQFDD